MMVAALDEFGEYSFGWIFTDLILAVLEVGGSCSLEILFIFRLFQLPVLSLLLLLPNFFSLKEKCKITGMSNLLLF